MAFNRYQNFVNLLIFYTFLQNDILKSTAEKQCLNPTFKQNQKIVVDYFFNSKDEIWPDADLCKIIGESNGLISMVFRISSDMAEKATCMESDYCMEDRRLACTYKLYHDSIDKCADEVPDRGIPDADCICIGGADDIAIANETALKKFGIQKTPVLIVDNKYDPCFTDYSLEGMKAYFCKGFQNVIPLCKT